MKNILIVILGFALGANAALTRTEVHDLIVRGEKGAAACNKIFDDIRLLDKKFDTGPIFPNKKVAIQVIKMLKKFPGTPHATKELMDKLVTSRTKGLDTVWLSKEMDRTLVCDPMSMNLVLTKLVRSSRRFAFSKTERKFLARTILTQLRKEAEFPTHLGLLAPYVLILDALVDQRAILLSEDAAIKREELRGELDRGLAKLKEKESELKKKVADKEFQTTNFIYEVRNNEPFRVKFLEFIDTL
jgi:hypothetical protein